MEELNLNNVWGDPQEYKGLNIYPVKMKDILIFNSVVECLMIEKNKIPDVNIIKMSYLNFLILQAEDHPEIIIGLKMLLDLIFKEITIKSIYKNNEIILLINDVEIDGNDFEKIRNIIFNQNLIIIDNMMLDEEMEKRLREAEEFLASKEKPATLEERIFSYGVSNNYQKYRQMYSYTYKCILIDKREAPHIEQSVCSDRRRITTYPISHQLLAIPKSLLNHNIRMK